MFPHDSKKKCQCLTMLMPQFSLFLSFRHTEQKEKRAGERMTQSFRKAAMSVNMSHNRDMFTDTLPSPKRDTQMAPLSTLSCIASPQCLFLMGIRSTKHIWLNLAQNEFEKTITSLYFFFVSLLSLNVFPHYYPDIPIGITKLLLYLLTNYYHTITVLLLSCKIK